MKKITAYIKPFRLEIVLEHLQVPGVLEVLLSEVRGYGRQKGKLESYREQEYVLAFLPKARVEVYCEDEACGQVIDAIVANARSGRIGDGKILIGIIELAQQG